MMQSKDKKLPFLKYNMIDAVCYTKMLLNFLYIAIKQHQSVL